MGYIYKVTNILNDKKYIGKTTLTVEARWKKHCERAKRELIRTEHFMLAIRKWGVENFKVETIEEIPNEQLDERERYWIAYYDTFFGNGYNSTLGGEGTVLYDREEIKALWDAGFSCVDISNRLGCARKTASSALKGMGITSKEIQQRAAVFNGQLSQKPVEQYSLEGIFIKEYNNAKIASNETNVGESCIRNACRGNVFGGNFFWKFKSNPKTIQQLIEEYNYNYCLNNCRSVDQYSITGDFIKTWRSLKDAADFYKCSISNIYRSCHHYYENARDYLWTYSDTNEDMEKRSYDYIHRVDPRSIGVNQFDLKGNFIHYYNSLNEASRETGIEKTALHKAFRNRYTSGGYVWLQPGEEDEWLEKIINRNKTKHDCKKKVVYQYSLEGEFLKSYSSAAEACIAMGVDPAKKRSLSRNCQGYQKTFNGYIWSYEAP